MAYPYNQNLPLMRLHCSYDWNLLHLCWHRPRPLGQRNCLSLILAARRLWLPRFLGPQWGFRGNRWRMISSCLLEHFVAVVAPRLKQTIIHHYKALSWKKHCIRPNSFLRIMRKNILKNIFFCNRRYSLLNSRLAPNGYLEALPFTYSVCCYG